MNLAPIVLFVFNRPEHTLKTLESLFQNDLADKSILYIFADGPPTNTTFSEREKIKKTGEVLKKKKWCKEVIINESDKNKGLANSILSGVSEIVNKYGKVIVLEDDLVLTKGFLKYMNEALTLYENENEVMQISGNLLPIFTEDVLNSESFFLKDLSCWGWATWKRAWDHLETDPQILMERIDSLPEGKKRFNLDCSYDFYNDLYENLIGSKKTWAIKWQASVFLKNGLILFPHKSLVTNIGNDGSGVHKGFTRKYINKNTTDYVSVRKIPIIPSEEIRKRIRDFYTTNIPKSSLFPIWLRKLIAKFIPLYIKTKIAQYWIK